MAYWRSFNLAWATDRVPVHVLLYHRMLARLAPELGAVFRFLNESSVRPSLRCAVRSREAHPRRQRPDWQTGAAAFSPAQRDFLNAAIDSLHGALQRQTGVSHQDILLWKR